MGKKLINSNYGNIQVIDMKTFCVALLLSLSTIGLAGEFNNAPSTQEIAQAYLKHRRTEGEIEFVELQNLKSPNKNHIVIETHERPFDILDLIEALESF